MMPVVAALWALGVTLAAGAPQTVVGGGHFVSAETGQFIMREIATEHGTRRYKLYIPGSYDGSKALPLIVMLHGCTQDPDDIARGTRLNESAEEKGALVAYPEQPESANIRKCWNWYEPAHQKRDEGEPALIASITRKVMEDYKVDHRHVYIAGISAGAAMAVTVALTYPDLYAAVGSHSGIPYGIATTVMEALGAMQGKGSADLLAAKAKTAMGTRVRPMPAILFQGASDHVVNPVNAMQLVAQFSSIQGAPPANKAVSTTGERVESANGYQYTRALRGSGDGAIELWVVEELGHAWSGGSTAGTFADAKGPNATTEMMRFFLEHPRPASGTAR